MGSVCHDLGRCHAITTPAGCAGEHHLMATPRRAPSLTVGHSACPAGRADRPSLCGPSGAASVRGFRSGGSDLRPGASSSRFGNRRPAGGAAGAGLGDRPWLVRSRGDGVADHHPVVLVVKDLAVPDVAPGEGLPEGQAAALAPKGTRMRVISPGLAHTVSFQPRSLAAGPTGLLVT